MIKIVRTRARIPDPIARDGVTHRRGSTPRTGPAGARIRAGIPPSDVDDAVSGRFARLPETAVRHLRFARGGGASMRTKGMLHEPPRVENPGRVAAAVESRRHGAPGFRPAFFDDSLPIGCGAGNSRFAAARRPEEFRPASDGRPGGHRCGGQVPARCMPVVVPWPGMLGADPNGATTFAARAVEERIAKRAPPSPLPSRLRSSSNEAGSTPSMRRSRRSPAPNAGGQRHVAPVPSEPRRERGLASRRAPAFAHPASRPSDCFRRHAAIETRPRALSALTRRCPRSVRRRATA